MRFKLKVRDYPTDSRDMKCDITLKLKGGYRHYIDAIKKMLADVGPRNIKRPGGYTRIIKVGNRQGDNAPMAKIELVEKPAKKKPTKTTKKKAAKVEEKPETKPKKEKVEMKAPKKESKVKRVLKKSRGRPKKTTGKGK